MQAQFLAAMSVLMEAQFLPAMVEPKQGSVGGAVAVPEIASEGELLQQRQQILQKADEDELLSGVAAAAPLQPEPSAPVQDGASEIASGDELPPRRRIPLKAEGTERGAAPTERGHRER